MSDDNDEVKGRRDFVPTITAVTSPLKFFTLSLLMVEALISILSLSQSPQLIYLSSLATFMFVMVVFTVTWLTIRAPGELLAQQTADIVNLTNKLSDKVQKISTIRTITEVIPNQQSLLEMEPMVETPVVKAPTPPRKK